MANRRVLSLALAGLLAAGCGDGSESDFVSNSGTAPIGVAQPVTQRTAYGEAELAANPNVNLKVGQMAVLTPETTQVYDGDLGTVGSDKVNFELLADQTKVILIVDSPNVQSASITRPSGQVMFSANSPGQNQQVLVRGSWSLVINARNAAVSAQGEPSDNSGEEGNDRPPAVFLSQEAGPVGTVIFRISGKPGASDFSYCDLSNISFEGANLQGARFSNVNLHSTNFTSANLQDTRFYQCKVDRASFWKSDLSRAAMGGLTGDTMWFSRTTANDSVWTDCALTNADFTLQKAEKATFSDCDFTEGVFNSVHYLDTSFQSCTFDNGYILDSTFQSSQLTKINASAADFSGTQWRDCQVTALGCQKGNFLEATMVASSFVDSDFTDTVFPRAIFDNVAFARSPFRRASFRTAQGFDRVSFKECDLSQAVAPDGTVFPEGTIK